MADANTVLLVHFDGSATDVSASAHPVALTAGAAISSTQKKFGSSSLAMSFSYMATVTGTLADFQFGAGQFTIEAWVYPTSSLSGVIGVITQWPAGGSDFGWFFGHVSGQVTFYYSLTGTDIPNIGAAWAPTTNQWYHLAVDRDAVGVVRVYVDGVVKVSATIASAFYGSSQSVVIGNDNGTARGFPGYLDEVRVSKGVARYGGAFTPPTVPFNGAVAARIPATIVWW